MIVNPKQMSINLGTRIKQLREAKGYSQQVVADHLGMTQANYHKLESDKSEIRLDHLEKMAELYKISLAEIITADRSTVHIENNNHNHNGVVLGEHSYIQNLLNTKDELLKLKDEKIAWLEAQLLGLRGK
jgi:transcriptional regulator with XRE-family HTH domain